MIERLLEYEAQQSGAEVLDSAGVPPPIQEADLARLLAALAQARQRWPTHPELTEETEATEPVLELTCDEEGPLGIDYDVFPVVSDVRSGSWADRWQQRTGTSLVGAELVAIQGQPLAGATAQAASQRFAEAGRPISLSFQPAGPPG